MSDAYTATLALLGRREYSVYELTNQLIRKGYDTKEIQAALAECQRLGYQSDLRCAEQFCRVRIRQGYGPLRITQELLSLHIDPEIIRIVLQQEQENWVGYAIAVWKKKYKVSGDRSYAALQKQKKFLAYRGFSTEVINQVFDD